VTAQYPLERETPVTRMRTQEMVSLIGSPAARRARRARRRRRGDRDQRLPVRPGARPRQAAERLARGRLRRADVDRILELVPLATHNQRGRGTLYVGTEQPSTPRTSSRSSSVDELAVYELLKRPDELFVVEHAHLQPRFVEDSVRVALKETLETYAELDDGDFLWSRQVNLETIHRTTSRGALRHRRRAARRARATASARTAHEARGVAHA
jgi:GTP cyclohydrolase FolE2